MRVVFRVALGVVLGLLAPAPDAAAEIPIIELDGVVHAVSAAHVVAAIEAADAAGAPMVILRLDTPGGFDVSMRTIIDKMLNCKTPVVAFVGPSGARAASAGFLITIVADIAAMAPGTNIGAAHPVSGMGQMDEVTAEKAAQDMAAYIRSKAERRGRNVEMAEKAVTESKSFTESEALELKLVDLVVQDVPALIEALEGREIERFDGSLVTLDLAGHVTRVVEMSWREAVLSAIARPEVLFLLLLGALAGLGTEISHPGLLFPGILGTVCLILFLFATQIIPINWAGVLLILLAIAMFAAEIKVTSYGLLTVGGMISMVLGAMMLVDAPTPALRISLSTLLPAVAAMTAWTLFVVKLVVDAQRRRPSTGQSGMLGQLGVAQTELGPGFDGWVMVQGERWCARADTAVALGDGVQVAQVQGLVLKVRKEK